MSILRIPIAKVFEPLLPSMRYKGAEGGRSRGASHHFAGQAIRLAIENPGLRICSIREVQKSLKRSSKQTIEDKLEQFNLKPMFGVNKQEIRTPGDGVIIFQGMQDHTADSIKSLEGFDIFMVEEADKLSQRSIDILTPTARSTPRTRLPQPEIWFAWNRRMPTDPVNVLFKDMPQHLGLCVRSTYRDNPWFPPELLAEVEWCRQRDPEKYAHVWEGGYLQRSAARVFNNWRVDEFDVPDDATLLWGSDWGFSVDPSVLVGSFLVGRTLFVAYEAWKVGCEIEDLPALFDTVDPERPGRARDWAITADSSRADTISFMRRHGYPAIAGARKGPGSVEDGVEFLRTLEIVVHPRCVHVIDELTHYSWKVDKLTDAVLPMLADAKNHTIDSLRYSVEGVRWAVAGDGFSLGSTAAAQAREASVSAPRFRPDDLGIAADVGDVAIAAFEETEYDAALT